MNKQLIAVIYLMMSFSLLSQEVPLPELSLDEIILELPGQQEASGTIELGPNQTISIDFPDEDVRTVMRNIADLQSLNLIIPDSLSGRTSIKLRNVTWEQAFELILYPLGYTFEKDRAIVHIIKEEDLETSFQIDALWSFAWLFLIIPSAIIHIALALGILKDSTQKTEFMGRYLWAFATLVTGFVSFATYWIIHHSNLGKK